jgi:hypothetical protein
VIDTETPSSGCSAAAADSQTGLPHRITDRTEVVAGDDVVWGGHDVKSERRNFYVNRRPDVITHVYPAVRFEAARHRQVELRPRGT